MCVHGQVICFLFYIILPSPFGHFTQPPTKILFGSVLLNARVGEGCRRTSISISLELSIQFTYTYVYSIMFYISILHIFFLFIS